ncbi:single-stranded DNA-binding protein [Candidatus Acidianus copahuensis]|uniref:Single-stranded DNA-binding protein n=1 Tax=Candidatus Acidianus copahuensis TaxID=1160895 RepID=A0A031LQY3_9CREN|nr:OB-fold nucleic acid binding domain-containing protein [Candidatus Acidianus copahuensis]EZQ10792.1 single-stranded DNA-binding protein [Candidatus Acidianus copahuensis]
MDEKIGNLKAGIENVNVTARILQVGDERSIQTRNGPRTIREIMVGDETGRVKLTVWGSREEELKEGQVIKIENGWTTAFKGQVQLNAGSKSKISEVEDGQIPEADEIPENIPTDNSPPPRRSFRGRGGGGFRGRRPRDEEE